MSSRTKILYTGVTSDLYGRVQQHKEKLIPGFTAKYNIKYLVYFEQFESIEDAIIREKQIKGWRREKKIALITTTNPRWRDLSLDWD
ncbi:MAG: GIY-YIG nuclease family protein [Anaerolineae bacterium]|nr:GIY-YIG nuclease family protein [Anaerolineae bacterium]